MNKFFSIVLLFLSGNVVSQKIVVLDSSQQASFRGLSVVNDQVVWVSGSGGTVGLSTDGGATWEWTKVKGFEKTDFRDIEAFDKHTAIIMGITRPACILKTVDGGDTWKTVFENKDTSIFLDAMEFWNDMSGIVIGDPVQGRFFIGRTFDGGNSWKTIPFSYEPEAIGGEACFAASGTNIRKLDRDEAVFVSGGHSSNIFIRDRKINLPLKQGTPTSGANSIAVYKKKTLVVVGGDFTKPDDTTGNCAVSFDGGNTWANSQIPPSGYRSCVEHIHKKQWITCGPSGVDITENNAKSWKNISRESFHVVRKAKKGDAVFFAGLNGKIGKLTE